MKEIIFKNFKSIIKGKFINNNQFKKICLKYVLGRCKLEVIKKNNKGKVVLYEVIH